MTDTRQLRIIHLSDLHFGEEHIFADKPQKESSGYKWDPSKACLSNSLIKEINNEGDWPTILVVTGDLTQSGKLAEYQYVEAFFDDLLSAEIIRSKEDIFVCPGNHDMDYKEEKPSIRWHTWLTFYQQYFGTTLPENSKCEFADRIWDRSSDLGIIIASFNSSYNAIKGTERENRGMIEENQIRVFNDKFKGLDSEKIKNSIKIGVVHHHPILIPSFHEANIGFDAIPQADKLLTKLRMYGFQLILHGHKHFPNVFTYDAKPAFVKNNSFPIVVFAGGSVGCSSISHPQVGQNTFNEIEVRLYPDEGIFKIQSETKGMALCDNNSNPAMLEYEREWRVIDTFRRNYLPFKQSPKPTIKEKGMNQSPSQIIREIKKARGYQPLFYVEPTFSVKDYFVARVWLKALFPSEQGENREIMKVVWSTQDYEIEISKDENGDQDFCVEIPISTTQLFACAIFFKDGFSPTISFNVPVPVLYSESNYYY
jgi:predicted MPP superfamily phosphohydrolase